MRPCQRTGDTALRAHFPWAAPAPPLGAAPLPLLVYSTSALSLSSADPNPRASGRSRLRLRFVEDVSTTRVSRFSAAPRRPSAPAERPMGFICSGVMFLARPSRITVHCHSAVHIQDHTEGTSRLYVLHGHRTGGMHMTHCTRRCTPPLTSLACPPTQPVPVGGDLQQLSSFSEAA